jgi:hypothetical protein
MSDVLTNIKKPHKGYDRVSSQTVTYDDNDYGGKTFYWTWSGKQHHRGIEIKTDSLSVTFKLCMCLLSDAVTC